MPSGFYNYITQPQTTTSSGGSSPTKEETLENKTISLEKNNITAENAVGEILIVNSDGIVEPLKVDNEVIEDITAFCISKLSYYDEG